MDPLNAQPLWLSDTPQLGRQVLTSPQPLPALPAHLAPNLDDQRTLFEEARRVVAAGIHLGELVQKLQTELRETQRQLWAAEAQGKRHQRRLAIHRRMILHLNAVQKQREAAWIIERDTLLQSVMAMATRVEAVEATLAARTFRGRWSRFQAWVRRLFSHDHVPLSG